MKPWWHREGVLVIREAYEVVLDEVVIVKAEAKWRVKSGELSQTSFGTFLRVYGQSLDITKCKPDLEDPATLGVLLDEVRTAYSGLVSISLGNCWWCVETDAMRWDDDNTESFGDALEQALGAAECTRSTSY